MNIILKRIKSLSKIQISLIVLCLIPVLLIIISTLHFSEHVPFWDQWELVEIFRNSSKGTLGWHDFWAQHNEHRILFPRLIMFSLAFFTNWDPYYETIVNLVLGISTTALFAMVMKKTLPKDSRLLFTIPLIVFMVLSPIQWENWLWGWQIQWFLSVITVAICLYHISLKKLNYKKLSIAVFAATVATYSLANGVTIWPIVLLILIIRKADIKSLIYWSISGIIISGINYINYVNPTALPSKSLFLHQPINFVHYILIYIGRPLSFDIHDSPYVGLFILLSFTLAVNYLFMRHREVFVKQLFWFGLALYGLAGAILTAVSRLGLGIDQSYSIRYTTVSTLFIIGTINLVIHAAYQIVKNNKYSSKRSLQYFMILFFVPIITFTGINYFKGFSQMSEQHKHLVKVRQCLINAESENDTCLLLAYPDNKIAWDRLKYLRQKDLGGF